MDHSDYRPTPGTKEHFDWLLSCMRLAAKRLGVAIEDLAREDVTSRSRNKFDIHWPNPRDIALGGGWLYLRRELLKLEAQSGAEGVKTSYDEPPPTRDLPLPAVNRVQPATAEEVADLADPLEVRRWKQKYADLQRTHEAVLKRLDIAERMRDHVKALRADSVPLGIQPREKMFGRREATAVVLASDWHVEELVEPAKVNGVNAYDLSIAERSAERFFEGIVWLLDNHANTFSIRDLVLWMGGDTFTGHIHEDNVESTAFSPLLASRFVRSLWVRGIRMLLQETELEQIIVPCNRGNHGRVTKKPRIATGAEHSFEQALYFQLADDFAKEPRVRFVVAPGELLYLNVYDRVIRFTHGDAVNYGGGVGGITIPINKAINQWDAQQRADLTCMGHWHQYVAARRVVVNGSLIGYSPYSVHIKADFEAPQQAFFLVDSRRGVCQTTPIWVREDDHVHELNPEASEEVRLRIASGEHIIL